MKPFVISNHHDISAVVVAVVVDVAVAVVVAVAVAVAQGRFLYNRNHHNTVIKLGAVVPWFIADTQMSNFIEIISSLIVGILRVSLAYGWPDGFEKVKCFQHL